MTRVCEGEGWLRRRWLMAATAAAWVGAGCVTSGGAIPGGPGTWPAVQMRDADVMPVLSDDPSRRTRVVVLASEDSPSARGLGLADVATAALESLLGAGGVEVVDRKLAAALDKELKLAELKGTGNYGGPDVADYAIRVVMGTAGANSTLVPASSGKNPLTGQTTTTPLSYTYNGTSNMTVRIYQLPSLRLVQSIQATGRTSVEKQPIAAGNVQNIAQMRGATDAGIKSKQNEVLNEFSPKGYVSERRVKDKKSIFRVLLGKQTGAKPGDLVAVYTLQKVVDLAKRESFEEVPLGTGRLSDAVSDAGSWMIVDDDKVAGAIRRGDIVRVKHAGCTVAEWRRCLTMNK